MKKQFPKKMEELKEHIREVKKRLLGIADDAKDERTKEQIMELYKRMK